ncbi:MAG: hypothetical protein ACE5NJ_05460, partial [Thermodesulfobacteriota bacterium]
GAAYMLWMFQRVMFGEIKNPENMKLRDLSRREIATMIPMVLLIFVMGIYPKVFFTKMDVSVDHFLKTFKAKYEMNVETSAPRIVSIRCAESTLEGNVSSSKID